MQARADVAGLITWDVSAGPRSIGRTSIGGHPERNLQKEPPGGVDPGPADHVRAGAIHQDVPFDKTMTAAVDGEIKDLAHWLEPDLALPG